MAIKPAGAPAPKRRAAPPKRAEGRAGGPSGRAEARDDAGSRPLQRRALLHRPPRGRGPGEPDRVPPRGRRAHVRRAAGAGRPDRQRAAGPGRAPGAARALPAARLAGVPGHLLGRDQDRGDPDPGEHHDAGRGLPVLPRRQPGPDRGGLGGAARRGRARAREGVAPAARGGGGARLREPDRLRRLGGRGGQPPRALRLLQGRPRVLALLVGLDRAPQGRGAPAARHGGVRRDVRQAGAGHDRERPHRLRGQALLRLRHGQQHDLSRSTWAGRGCCTRTGRRRRRCSR